MNIAYITNAEQTSGVGERATAIAQQLRQRGWELDEIQLDGVRGEVRRSNEVILTRDSWPGSLGSKSINWIRLGRALERQLSSYSLVHLTNQSLGFLGSGLRAPVVVTVHDLIERLEPQSLGSGFLARYLYRGIPLAAHVIAVSHYTAQTVQRVYDISAERISVIYNGVGPEFRSLNSSVTVQVRSELGLPAAKRIVLVVGSDHPRKNPTIALDIFAQVAAARSDVVLVKVGTAGVRSGRQRFLSAVQRLGMRDRVFIFDVVTQAQLVALYNEASVLLFPSRHEGFGLPPLQAIACGLPVMTTNATSLPEVVGNDAQWGIQAAAVHDPNDLKGMVASTARILDDQLYAAELREKGLRRAQQFTWEQAGAAVEEVYKKVLA